MCETDKRGEFLTPQHGASSMCGCRNGLQYGGYLRIYWQSSRGQTTRGDPQTRRLGEILTTWHRNKPQRYKIFHKALGLNRSVGTTETMKKCHKMWHLETDGVQDFGGKTWDKETIWKLRRRWENIIKIYIQGVGWGDVVWIDLAQDRDKWKATVNAVMNPRVPIKYGEFLD